MFIPPALDSIPLLESLAAAREMGLAPLEENTLPRPDTPPVGRVENLLFWRKEDLEPLRTRKGWRKEKRRIPPNTPAMKTMQTGEQVVELFALHQTISDDEWYAIQKQRYATALTAWLQQRQTLEQRLQNWLAQVSDLPPPEAEEELLSFLGERDGLQAEADLLPRPFHLPEIPPPAFDEKLWQQARDAHFSRRFQQVVQEGHVEDLEMARDVDRELRRAEKEEEEDFSGFFGYWKYYGRFLKAYELRQLEREAADLTRIHAFHELFPARSYFRAFTLYLGPTNSGKTYQALLRLKEAKKGIYLAPLRLLALEVSETLNGWGVPCNMVTGEERILVDGSQHTASTIEMLNLHNQYDLCVIDEAQMLGDPDRGWAWTQAILGVQAKEVCIVGAPESLPAIRKLLDLTGDPYQVVHLERMSPLLPLNQPVKRFAELKPGTALIAFSRAAVLSLKEAVEKETGQRAAIVYGALPPEARRHQAKLFASGEAPYLVATDAIGMGLNLPIETLLFAEDRKFIDRQEVALTPLEVRQIAGRAGRFGKNEVGYVGTFRCPIHTITDALQKTPPPIARAHLSPNLDHLLAISSLDGRENRASLARLFTLFTRLVKPDPTVYRLSDLTDQTTLARIADRHRNLDLPTRFALSSAPVPLRSNRAVAAFERMVEAVARRQHLSLAQLEENILGPGSDFSLMGLETGMQVVNLYSWLHYRFQEHFPDLDRASKRRREIVGKIDRLLARRATQDDPPMEPRPPRRHVPRGGYGGRGGRSRGGAP